MTQDSSINTNISLNDGGKEKITPHSPLFTKEMLHNMRFNIKSNMKLMIIIGVLHFAAAPLIILAWITDIITKGHSEPDDAYLVIGVLTTACAALSGIICAVTVYPYLYNKSRVDMQLSLPMTTTQRFISDGLSGLFIYLIPYLIAEALAAIEMLIGHLLCDGRFFTASSDIYDQNKTWFCDVFSTAAPYFGKLVLGGFVIMLMVFTLTAFVSSCCGTIFESIAYTLMINALIPLTICMFIAAFIQNINGLDPEYYLYRYATFFSPGGAVAGLAVSIGTDARSIISFSSWLIGNLVIAIAFGAGAFLLYRRRKAEDVGNPFVFKLLYYILITAALADIIFAFLMQDNDMDILLPMLIVSFIMYMILDVITNRGFRKFGFTVIRYAVTTGCCIGAFALIKGTGCFGAGNYIPSVDSVSKVYISYDGCYSDSSYYSVLDSLTDSSCISDPDNIRTVVEAHKSIIGSEQSDKHYYKDISFVYKLKNGRTVVRHYNQFITLETTEILSRLDCTEEFKRLRGEKIYNDLIRNYEIRTKSSYSNSAGYAVLSPQWRYGSSEYGLDGSVSIALNKLPEDFVPRLAECIRDDIIAESENDYFGRSGRLGYITIYDTYSCTVKENYTKTMSYLASCGFGEIPEVTPELAENFTRSERISIESSIVNDRITGEHYPTITVNNNGFSAFDEEYEVYIYTSEYAVVKSHSSEIYELLKVSKKQYKCDENCYTITVNGNTAVIPPQYSELAKKVYICTVAESALEYAYDHNSEDADLSRRVFLKRFLECYSEQEITAALSDSEKNHDADAVYTLLSRIAESDIG
ncbi:MAG: hypothetical protein ACI4KF_09125 [Huintestinicola sp.]